MIWLLRLLGRSQAQNAIQPMEYASQPVITPKRAAAGTLAAIVGTGVAIALGINTPKEESGRTVDATLNDDGSLNVRHISGKQYLKAYLDVSGHATACDGIITYKGKRIKIGDSFTEEQCSAMLEEELVKHAKGAMACSPGIALSDDPATEKRREGPRFSAVDHAYHFGISAYCGSSVNKRFNQGNYVAGCANLMLWNKTRINGVLTPLKSLTNRQARSREVCDNGLGALK